MLDKFERLVKLMADHRIDVMLTLILLIAAGAGWTAWENRQNIINGVGAKRCIMIPTGGHHIVPAPPGQDATVIISGINKLDDCGIANVYGTVSNGDGILHDAKQSTTTMNLMMGVRDEFKYSFTVPHNAQPGRAFYKATINFPQQGRTIDAPRIYFRIPAKNEVVENEVG